MRTAGALAFGLAAACFAVTDAAACFAPSHRTVFFEDVPAGISAPVAAKVVVTAIGEGNVGAPGEKFAIARIERVIKGTIDRPMVWIAVPGYVPYVSCSGPWIGVGARGIVLGTLQQSEKGALLLFVKQNDGRYFRSPSDESGNP